MHILLIFWEIHHLNCIILNCCWLSITDFILLERLQMTLPVCWKYKIFYTKWKIRNIFRLNHCSLPVMKCKSWTHDSVMNVLYCHDCVSGEWAVSDQSIECDPGQLSEIRHQTNISALTPYSSQPELRLRRFLYCSVLSVTIVNTNDLNNSRSQMWTHSYHGQNQSPHHLHPQ